MSKKILALIIACLFIGTITQAQNLLTNPGAESNYDGWTITNGGDGWGIDGSSLSGSACWTSSYNISTMTQTIDLLSNGYTEVQLDAAPVISAGIYVRTNSNSGGTISITVELLNSSDVVVYTKKIADNALIDKDLDWSLESSYISNYGSGVRKIRFTFSGSDNVGWAGHYGPGFDDAYVNIVNSGCVANTTSASNKQIHSATLSASIYNSDTDSKTVQFEYGTSTSLGTAVTADQSPVTATGESQVSATINNLAPSTTYYYRVSATDGTTTQTGSILSFTTLTPILTISATKVNMESAANSTATLSISSNTSWNISYDNTWLTIDKTSGTGDATLTLTANDNTTGIGRFIELSITSPDYKTQTVVVYQKGINSQVSLAAMEMGSDHDATAPILDQTVQNIKTLQTSGYLRIKPLETATYTFTSASSTDPIIIIRQASAIDTYVATSDDEGGNSQFKVSVSLTAGELYYLEIFNYSIDGGDITLTISGSKLQSFDYTGTGNWSETANWNWGCLPSGYNNATITGNATADQDISIQDLTIAPAGVLTNNDHSLRASSITLLADATQTATLLTNVENLTATTQTYLTGNTWHVYSPTTSAGSIRSFIQNTDNNLPVKTDAYGMMDYDEANNSWNNYFTSSTTDNLLAGKGYGLRCSSDGTVSTFGNIIAGDYSVTLTKAGEGWNCIGNPYTSAININATSDNGSFLYYNTVTNTNILDSNYGAVYIWDPESNQYKVICNADFSFTTTEPTRVLSQNYIASGQGFFVKAAANGANISFTPAMQSHQNSTNAPLKSAKVSWPAIQLTMTNGTNVASTVIAFNNQMTKGLDPTYDAGLLRGTTGLEIYSRLVTDNRVDFAIQCLPEDYNSLVIPIGLESKTGGEITFSAETVQLPADCSVILEDRENNTFTSLIDGATYKTTVSAGTTAIGRFYIHSGNLTTGTSGLENSLFNLKAYYAKGEIIIEGKLDTNAKALLFDISGRAFGSYQLQEGSRNTISASGLKTGVYLLKVTDDDKQFSTKLVIY